MTRYKVDGWNNFCRVFELPEQFSNEFCFGGGTPTTFIMVDWFHPIMDKRLPNYPAISKAEWEIKVGPIKHIEISLYDLEKTLVPFLLRKPYIKKGHKYLILYEFGAATVFSA